MLAAIKAVRFFTLPLIFLTALGNAGVVCAQAYPAKTVRIVTTDVGGPKASLDSRPAAAQTLLRASFAPH